LLLEQLRLDYRWVEVDSAAGETRTAAFLAMNPTGQVPLLEVEPGRYLPESNAILCYLAEGTPLWPVDRWSRAQALRWMFFEQYSHEPCVAVARFIARWLPADHPRRAELPRLVERGRQALSVMERRLSESPFMAGEAYSVADIALFAYTHCAPDGGIALDDYPAIRAWLDRVRGQPGFVPMQA
jgi:glutathione S-transferase